MDYLSIAVFIFLLALFVFYPKYLFATKFIAHYSKLTSLKARRLSVKTKVLCATPFLNNALLHRVMERRIHSLIDKVIGILFCVAFFITTIEQILKTINPWIILVSWFFLMTIYAVSWINDAVFVFKMAMILERGHVGILCIFPPLCSFLLISAIAPYFKKNRDQLTGAFEPKYL